MGKGDNESVPRRQQGVVEPSIQDQSVDGCKEVSLKVCELYLGATDQIEIPRPISSSSSSSSITDQISSEGSLQTLARLEWVRTIWPPYGLRELRRERLPRRGGESGIGIALSISSSSLGEAGRLRLGFGTSASDTMISGTVLGSSS